MAYARLLYDFLETPAGERRQKHEVAEDFGHQSKRIDLPDADRQRLNKDLMHFTYDRLRHTPESKAWPDSILAKLNEPVIVFMRHVRGQADLFPREHDFESWRTLLEYIESGKHLLISCRFEGKECLTFNISLGPALPSGKAALTKFGRPLTAS